MSRYLVISADNIYTTDTLDDEVRCDAMSGFVRIVDTISATELIEGEWYDLHKQ
jgi:hypothetical protein